MDGKRLKRADLTGQIYSGDFLQVGRQLPPRKFSVIIADPPYNIGKDFGNGSDCQPMSEYLDWTDEWSSLCKELLAENGVLYIYGFSEILARISVRHPIEQQRWLVWHYTNKTTPRLQFWQRSHESILCLWRNARPNLEVDQIREGYTNSYKKCLGRVRKGTPSRFGNGKETIYNGHENGALPRDVIKLPALAGGAGRNERWFLCRTCGDKLHPPQDLKCHAGHDVLKHPTQKPMALTRRLILSRINGTGSLLVPFAGSGSECVTAQSLNVDYVGVEINEDYVHFAKEWLSCTT